MNNHLIGNTINLILNNNLIFDDSFPFLFDSNYKNISFLNNKRNILNNSDKCAENLKDFNEYSFNKKDNLKILNNKNKCIFKIFKDFSKIKYNNNYNFTKINRNITYKHNNLYNYKIEKCNYIFINKSDKKINKLQNSIIIKDINKDINNIKEENNLSEINSKNNINNTDNLSNEIKVKKNNKMIYINKLLLKPKNTKKDIIPKEKKRNSIYRGVSKNGNKWQVIIYSKYCKKYIGLYKTQEIAARIYDIISIKNKGIKAKTNFIYNLHQIQKITDTKIDYKSKNIEEIIYYLIKEL